jgi:acetyltransferase-like isoleucine patch superfamily enzyme
MFHMKRHILKEGRFCKSSFHENFSWPGKISKGTEVVLPNFRLYTRSHDFTKRTKILNLRLMAYETIKYTERL